MKEPKEEIFLLQKDWGFLNWDPPGTQNSHQNAIKAAAKYFKQKILKNFKNEKDLLIKIPTTIELKNKGHNDFLNAIYRRKISYNAILVECGFQPNQMKDKWHLFDWNNSGNPRSKKKAIENASNFLLQNIMNEKFINEFDLREHQSPTQKQIEKYHKGYLSAIYKRDITLTDVIKITNLKHNKKIGRWDMFNWGKNDKPRSKSSALKNASNYLMNTLSKIDDLNECLTEEYLKELGHNDFISAIESRKLSYNDILRKSGLKTNISKGKWSFLNWSQKGIPRTKKQALENAAEYFLKNIMKKKIKISLGLEDYEAPTREELFDLGYQKFFYAIYNQKLSYNDILRKAGLKLNLSKRKWSFLNWNQKGIPRSKEQALQNAAEFLKNNILTKNFKENYNLSDSEAPVTSINDKILKNFLYRGLYPRGLTYNEVLDIAGFLLHEQSVYAKIGRMMHWIAERIFLEYTRNNGCLSFYEIYPNKYDKKYNSFHCDNTVLVNERLKDFFKNPTILDENIKMINIDYFLGASEKRIKAHCLKGYQGKFKLLILVPINLKASKSPPIKIPYKRNVKIMSPLDFSRFFGYQESFCSEFKQMVEIVKKATYKKKFQNILEIQSKKSRKTIIRHYNFGQIQLEQELKDCINLLKYHPEGSSLDFYI
ncbi:MAG: hypothetical protein ACQERB_05090 [Promethearchaeati archaeon]